MPKWFGIIFGTLRSTLRTQRDLAPENLALRQQVAVLKSRYARPGLTDILAGYRSTATSGVFDRVQVYTDASVLRLACLYSLWPRWSRLAYALLPRGELL